MHKLKRDKALSENRKLRSKFSVKNRLSIVFLLILFLAVSVPADAIDDDAMDQALVKALYTYKFGKFTQWPNTKLNSATSDFQYCIIGTSHFPQNTLNMLSEKKVQGRPLSLAVFESGLIPEEVLSTCHILYISESEKQRLFTILESLKGKPVLTVSDIQEFSNQGGMITLTEKQGKVRFQINPEAFQQAGLSISSKIMKLAEIVDDKRH